MGARDVSANEGTTGGSRWTTTPAEAWVGSLPSRLYRTQRSGRRLERKVLRPATPSLQNVLDRICDGLSAVERSELVSARHINYRRPSLEELS